MKPKEIKWLAQIHMRVKMSVGIPFPRSFDFPHVTQEYSSWIYVNKQMS